MAPRKPSARSGGRPKGRSGPTRGGNAPKGRSRKGSGQRGTTPIRSDSGGKRTLGGDHVEGRQAVRELLLAGTRRTREIIMAADLDDAAILDDIREIAHDEHVQIRELSRSKFEQESLTASSQGVIARAAPLPEFSLDELARPADGKKPFLLVMDGVTDPGNLGAALRTAECAGVTGIVLPKHRAARITPTVTKTAAGAIEHLPMCVAPGIASALSTLRDSEVWTVGLAGDATDSLFGLQVGDQPVALVLGSEGDGLSRLVRERCDTVVSIPLTGALGSLNVSAAAAIACYEVARARLP